MTSGEEDFGFRLRRVRLAKGMSQKSLAEIVRYDTGHISRIERGERRPTRSFALHCDGALEADGALISVYDDLFGRRESTVAEDSPPVTNPITWIMTLGADFPGVSGLHLVSHRELLGILGPVVTSTARAGWPVAGREQALRLWAPMFELTRHLGRSATPRLVFPLALIIARGVDQVVGHSTGRMRAKALLLGSRVSEFAGWMAQELGDDTLALHWTDRAAAMAKEGGDRELVDYCQVRKALIALYGRDGRMAAGLVEHITVRGGTGSRLKWLATLRMAQGQALAADVTGCRRSLERARALADFSLTSMTNTPDLGPSTVPDLTAIVTGGCLVELGSPGEGMRMLESAVGSIPSSSHRSRARFGLKLVAARLAVGDVGTATEELETLLHSVDVVDSATIRKELHDVDVLLRRWAGHESVAAIRPKIAVALVR
ncbi:helix-turn-helix transcriptional regulator [Herbidospora sp. NBRC 101105]|uniref:helix-turn-helix domain-containing protein n=1 Tax=Herbidospora sp. NBRC 101105 TaxID=3032195 RepID=UPI0024A25805|nr:helix-turn-helix transcriptional regulator [Herbidospora sp. NBRC 101105]GLX93084.1 hypothetical protein Hesp01_10340 [Herbidospora sp. NBRC 101105]